VVKSLADIVPKSTTNNILGKTQINQAIINFLVSDNFSILVNNNKSRFMNRPALKKDYACPWASRN
jgi:hypothetical protein